MRRLDWLDALRGLAAITVVLFHLSPQVIGDEAHLAVMRQIDLGKYAVLLFFLVSGYVIPMSLERHGSLRRFWIGRLCRIYPAYLVTIGLFALLAAAGLLHWQASLRAETGAGVLAHITMMPDLVGVRGVVRVFWTLSYEMVFYLVVAGLFAARAHRHSAWYAAGLGLVAGLGGAYLPESSTGNSWSDRRLLAAVLVLVVGLTLIWQVKGLAAGAIGIAFVLLPALNGHAGPGSTVRSSAQGLLLLAVMFAGTVIYRWQHRQIGDVPAVLALVVVTGALIGDQGLGTALAVVATFLLAYVFRKRAMPQGLTWLGRISYSLYLLHVVVLFMIPRLVPDLGTQGLPTRVAAGVAYVIIVLTLAAIGYRIVEQPGQALGRRLAARIDASHLPHTQSAAPRTTRGDNARESV
ncbi:acyltransferase [Actinoplanes sp. Pm04-4]|uniref:Acyltransferase n=1 Tax=Paractinoplanes pyxinae TaxID=2997416 RepID=A0ABT4AZ25_9ACTN|nr:acyltransferase [Actinoplanes pyxinae]MCY1139503.1 acyltransferase [Actinoplanes pyxinae]